MKSTGRILIIKILVLSAVCCRLLFLPLSAQQFHGGLLVGITASQVDGDSHAGFNKVGLQGGVFVNTNLRNNFGAQLEIRYAGKGASSGDAEIYKLALHYIDLPIMFNYTFKKKVVFDLGLVPGYLFAKTGEWKDDSPLEPTDIKKYDLATLIGVNYKLSKKILINLRYSYSLASIRNYDRFGSIGNLFSYRTGDYNNYLTLGLYYQFLN
jgi:opacity protein-like surface antigen